MEEVIKSLINIMNQIINILPTIVTLIIGSILGYFFSNRRYKYQTKIEYIQKQINEFYSPMVAIRKEILAKSELRVKIQKTAEEVWQEECKLGFPGQEPIEKYYEPYKKIIEYDNNQLKNELLPKYKEMFKLFTKNYWLAEPETKKWFDNYHSFIEIWNRWEEKSLPPKVIQRLDHEEKYIKPFYAELENRLEALKRKLK